MKQYRLDLEEAGAAPPRGTGIVFDADPDADTGRPRGRTPRPVAMALALGAAATLGVAFALWPVTDVRERPEPVATAAVPQRGHSTGPALAARATVEGRTAAMPRQEVPAAPTACALQWLGVQGATPQCLGSTEVAQNGDLRRHTARVQGRPAWQLEIDGGLGVVRAVRVVAEDGSVWRCGVDEAGEAAGPPCRGAAIGAPDLQGARVLRLQSTALAFVPATVADRSTRPTPAATANAAAERLEVSAQLVALGDEADPARACPAEAIDVVGPDHGAFRLCPSGGAGAVRATAADGRPVWHYTLRGLAGDTLEIRVDADGQVDELRLGSYACSGPACAGAETWPGPVADVATGRVFRFSGVALQDPAQPGRFTTLNGSATMPEL